MSSYYSIPRKADWNYGGPRWKLSRSKIDLFQECARCFYLDNKLGLKRPPGYPFNLNSAVDTLLKTEFDLHRANGGQHPLQKQYGLKARPVENSAGSSLESAPRMSPSPGIFGKMGSVMKIFIDESGDLGFSSGSSKWFVVTLLLTSHHRKIEKCVKKVHRGLRKKDKNVRELHAYHERDATRKRILELISEVEDVQVLCVILNKTKVYTRLHDQKSVLYNYVTNILLDRLNRSGVLDGVEDIEICIDQKETNKFMNDHFVRYLRQATSAWEQDRVDIRLAHSHNEKCLQAIDFVSWAIFRKYERGDYDFYHIIQDKIVGENFLFK